MRVVPGPLVRGGLRTCCLAAMVLTCAVSTGVAQAQAPASTPDRPAPIARTGAVGPSGEAMPVGNLRGWRQIFTDDFTDTVPVGGFPDEVSAKWDAYPSPWKDTSTFGRYSPERIVSIAGGRLNKSIRTVGGVPLVAALLPKVPGSSSHGQRYGRYAVRFRADDLPGYKMAWMLWPDSGAQRVEGEIDFPEKNIASPDVWAFVHRRDAANGDDQFWARRVLDVDTWHTAVIEWTPNLVVFILDGREIGRTTERVPDTPMHWVLQTEVSLGGAKPSPAVDGNVQIDWVAAWAYAPEVRPAPDTTGPVVDLASVADGDRLAGAVPLAVTASDPGGIRQTKWYVDGVEIGYDGGSAPWTDVWDSEEVADGRHRMWAKAADAAGNWSTSRSIVVHVAND